MNRIGILAYGSLIEDPGVEIKPLIQARIGNIETPFSIEFSRSSSYRDGAPTVVPVQKGGSPVKATILVLKDSVTSEKAVDLVWRRETRNETTEKHYKNPVNPTLNQVVVEKVHNFGGIDCVLYTKMGTNIEAPTPVKLAELAIKSAKSDAGKDGKDGISYLISLKRQNIETPLMSEYEKHILLSLGVDKLEEALKVALKTHNKAK